MGLLLLAFLAVHGHAGVVRQWLGTAHRHDGGHLATKGPVVTALSAKPAMRTAPAAAEASLARIDDWLIMLRVWRQDRHANSHALGLSAHAHRHDAVERHHHDIGDASVAALDDGGAAGQRGADGPAAASAIGAELPPGLTGAHGLATVARVAAAWAWPQAPTQAWQNALTRLPERPPQA